MGTCRPLVEIAAATLAGGDKNQDRYAYGDGWAFVLDGASSFEKAKSEHDGGWYAEQLKRSLSTGLEGNHAGPTVEIVEDAIRAVAKMHGRDPESCPTSTIALARWDDNSVEYYVLGDSTVVLLSPDSEEVVSDARMEDIALPLRQEYRSRLRDGYGFDERHRALLQELQVKQAVARNLTGGYWIAGVDPTAAHHALTGHRPLTTTCAIILATDGVAAGARYGSFKTWRGLASRDFAEVLHAVHSAEAADPQAANWPRSKRHDDKTALSIVFHDSPKLDKDSA